MKLPIPDDWDGESFFCSQIQWPDSPQYVGLLIGFLSAMTRGRTWKESTGSVLDAQAIGREIFYMNFPFTDCNGDTSEDGNNEDPITGADQEALIGAICMECSIPYDSLRWNNGVLEYRYCGNWYAVSGTPGAPDWGDPGDEDIGDEPDGWVGATACSKTVAATDALFTIVDHMIDQAGDDAWPFDGLVVVRAAYPTVNWDDVALLSAYLSALKLPIPGFDEQAKDPVARQDLKCRMKELISTGNQGMTPEEYTACQSAVWNWGKAHFTFGEYGIFDIEIQNLYYKAWKAFGPGDMRKITTMASATGDEDCSCAGDDAGYDGGVYFTGASSSGSGTGCVIEGVDVQEEGQSVVLTLAGSNGDWRDLNDIKLTIAGTDGVENLVIRMSPDSGLECPTEEWQTFQPVTNPTQWMIPILLDTTDTQVGAHSYANGPGYLEVRSIRDPGDNLFGKVEMDARWAPQTGGFGGTKRYYVKFKIVEVNLEDYR